MTKKLFLDELFYVFMDNGYMFLEKVCKQNILFLVKKCYAARKCRKDDL